MFGRKEKAALAALPPQHRSLAADHVLAVAQTARQWDELFQSLTMHEQLVRRHPLPPRVREVLLPLVRVLSQDVGPDGVIGATADLRGPEVPGKLHPGRPLQPVPPVTKIDETVSWDPWLVLSADLRNGAHLDVTLVDVGRIHKLRKRSSSGKTKWKTKRKASQRIAITLKTAKGAVVVPPPPSPATQWLRVSAQPKGTRHVISAKAKYPLPSTPQPGWQLNTIMLAVAEVFRWVPEPAADDAGGAA
jgi:hypothetical protein